MGLARKLHKSVARRNSGVTTSSVNVEPTAVSLAYITRMKRECSNISIGPSVKQNNIENYLRTYTRLNFKFRCNAFILLRAALDS